MAEEVKARARRIAADLLEVAEPDLAWEDGRFVVAGAPDRSIGLPDVAAAAARLEDPESRLQATGRFSLPGPVFPFGAFGAVVEIDPETGATRVLKLVAVDDPGRVVNPLLAEGQVQGSIAQGLAAVLLEEAVYDEAGQLVNGSFAEYGIPSAADLQLDLRTELRSTPSPLNPLGAKGLGESGTIAVPAVVAGAVADALAPLGVRHVDPPFTAERVWRVIRAARERRA
jgi:carbon-monoxide dehydrogenase large subunit